MAARPLVSWVWLMGSLLTGGDPDPVAAYLAVGILLLAAARWSATVRREGAVALVLFDAPVVFTIARVQAWPPGFSAALATAGLLAGLALLRRRTLLP